MVMLHEISEEASSSSSTHRHGYDVFLSFRGLDTRHSFTNHLYNALMHANINTFLDDEEIETGEDLKPELESAIKASRASVIVLSTNYATSTWCLDELVLILEQHMKSNHLVIPIFYHVEPTNVRKQQSSFGDAMAKHRQRMEAETDANKRSNLAQKMDQWNKALTKIADLKGKDANGRPEAALIEETVKDIHRRLRISSRFPLPQLIGMDDSIKFIISWLKDASSHTTDILSIVGIGGIGKTSIAKYVYALHSHEFDTSAFIEDISRRCDRNYNGIIGVQNELYYEISKPCSVQVHDVSMYTSMIVNAIAHRKAFLVLDDIGSLDQLNALLGSKDFHPGTKIIITTKDAWLTESCELFRTNIRPKPVTYKIQGLSEIDSQKLLCFHAFMCNNLKADYEEVSKNLVKYCQGHPLALKVLGRSLHNRDVGYWEGYIDRLKKENGPFISNVLRASYDSLPFKNDKELFKHICCFFVGEDRDVTETILNACDMDTRSGITNLIDRCLLDIWWNNEFMTIELTMHQLVQEMGRFLVREESSDKPWERSRLWCHEESFRVLKQNKGTKNVLGLALDMRMLEKEKLCGSCELKTDALSKMDDLMLLKLSYVQITGSYKNFPKELRWLCMHEFPLKYIPSDLPMENLVSLDMSYSKIESFDICYSNPQPLHERLMQLIGPCLCLYSKDKRLLRSLKILNLSFCKQLRTLRGFDHLPSLERLILRRCTGLLDVSESIEKCEELVLVDLSYCKKLVNLPKIISMLKKVDSLSLKGCNLGESQIGIRDIDSTEKLKADNNGKNIKRPSSVVLKAIPSDLKFFTIPLPRSLVRLSLADNNLSNESFPMDFSCLVMLKELYLDYNPIVSLPNCVRTLPGLERLSMVACNMLTSVEHPQNTLKFMQIYIESDEPRLRKVAYDPKIKMVINRGSLGTSSFEFEGMIKIQPMEIVEEKILSSLGWNKLEFPIGQRMAVFFIGRRKESEIQMYYEFGIFSTICGGEEMPNWITDRSTGPSISFTIPSSFNKLRGLNFCYVATSGSDLTLNLPVIKICNITKNLTWMYQHYIEAVEVDGGCLMFLSHWMFGMNEMECGDHVTITLKENPDDIGNAVTNVIKECGVSLVHEEEEEEEEDVLSYYKSWNNIIGRDLTKLQSTTGEYVLTRSQIWRPYP
ncbi:disease resistance protein RUN1 [Lactuca sativa]|uniref:TIR domain-containing protein n=1 Tax=Lactuca sativa TaxID=4236 RepID=A0A9R1WPN8_LACSA|nr:disease resistance protein RUN1 [Lactuca sativa]KAJ0226482.1 hypothetical protein LSAT_V11C100040230 [Lactuca sativa]